MTITRLLSQTELVQLHQKTNKLLELLQMSGYCMDLVCEIRTILDGTENTLETANVTNESSSNGVQCRTCRCSDKD